MAGAVAVEGLAELQRALARVEKDVSKELKGLLREVAEPIQADAQRLAIEEISGMRRQAARGVTPKWSRMRIGVTRKLIYVAPKEHGHHGRGGRAAFGDYLQIKAMDPALERHEAEIMPAVERMMDKLADQAGF